MKLQHLEPRALSGFRVRTTNVNESKPETGKIPALWQKFYQHLAPKLDDDSAVFGVYANYQSDHTGEFDVIACTDAEVSAESTTQITLGGGDYLVFDVEGEMPQAIISAWQQVWQYFASENCRYIRAYTEDFELYKSPTQAEICIAVKQ